VRKDEDPLGSGGEGGGATKRWRCYREVCIDFGSDFKTKNEVR